MNQKTWWISASLLAYVLLGAALVSTKKDLTTATTPELDSYRRTLFPDEDTENPNVDPLRRDTRFVMFLVYLPDSFYRGRQYCLSLIREPDEQRKEIWKMCEVRASFNDVFKITLNWALWPAGVYRIEAQREEDGELSTYTIEIN